MSELMTAPLFRMSIEVGMPPQIVGRTPMGYVRRMMVVTGGYFEGERLRGTVLPGGGDAVIVRPDGVLVLDVRLMLQTDEGEAIYLTYTGRRGGPPDVVERFGRGEVVPEGADYFRVAAQFECASERLGWLNDIVAVGIGWRPSQGPIYDVYEVL